MNPNRATAIAFAAVAAILALTVARTKGPSPLPSTAPSEQFSAVRAITTLTEILGSDTPHPVGTAWHDVVRDRVASRFRQLGYATSIQQTFVCNADVTCAPVANVIARLPGDARADTLVVSAHYDSVAAGPGASDDGVGVATILEIARAVRQERYRNTIIFLITDGEEDGLLGAEAFAADPAVSRGVAAAINVDNRGTSGRSYLFETSRYNRWLLPLVSRALPNPVASSFFYAVYQLLPNDTDLSAFRRAGIAGINFACIGGVARYHTPLDNLRHVTPASVQDHGDHMLGMMRAMAGTDLRQSTSEDAVFFDVLSLAIVWWPESWSMWMAAGALVALLAAATIRSRDQETAAGAITAGVASFFISIFAAALLGAAASWIASLRAPVANWLAQPGPITAAMWLIGIATAMVCARLMHTRAGFDGLFLGHGICWTAVGIALCVKLPGGSYLAVVPAMAFALCAALRASIDLSETASTWITAAVTALLWFPILITLYDAMGRTALIPIAAAVAMVSTTFTPIAATAASMRRAALAAMFTTAAVCLAMQLLIPAYTAESPRRINVEYVDDNGTTKWQVDGLTRTLHDAAPFSIAPNPEWLSRAPRVFTAPAPRLPISPPELRIVSDDRSAGRRLTLHMRTTRGAEVMSLIFRAREFAAVRVNGVAPPPQQSKVARGLLTGWHLVTLRGTPQAIIEIQLRRNEPMDIIVGDRSFALPPEAVPLSRARDAAPAVPSNYGDGIRVRRKLRL